MAKHYTVVRSGTRSFHMRKETRCRGRGRSIHRHPGQTVQANGASNANLYRKRAQYDPGRRVTLQVQISPTDGHTREAGAAR